MIKIFLGSFEQLQLLLSRYSVWVVIYSEFLIGWCWWVQMILFQMIRFRSDFLRYCHHFRMNHFRSMSHHCLFWVLNRVISVIIIDQVLLHSEIQFLFWSSDWAIQDLILIRRTLKRHHFGLNQNVSCFARNKLLNCPIIDFDAPKSNFITRVILTFCLRWLEISLIEIGIFSLDHQPSKM